MSDYFDNDIYYKIYNSSKTSPVDMVSIAENQPEDLKEKIKVVYPFSVFATDSMISLLSQTNRLNKVDEFIWDQNTGL
jgi:hypothetical protein